MNKILFLLVGASGSGKSYAERLLCKHDDIEKVVSMTTRPKRPNEVDGVDYYFVNNRIFEAVEKIENVEFGGNHYAVPSFEIRGDTNKVLVVEPKGLIQIFDNRELIKNYILFVVFFNIPLEARKGKMLQRGDSIEHVEKRIEIDNINSEFEELKIAPDVTISEYLQDVDNFIINKAKQFILSD